jgi:hypothetical protein
MKLFSKITEKASNAWYGAGAALTVMLLATPSEAAGLSTLYTGTWKDQMQTVSKVISGGAFVAGIVLIAGGLMKLKQAVDSQGQQTKYGDGLWRLALGSALCALPVVAGVGKGTLIGSSDASNSQLFDDTFKVNAQ